MHLNVHFSNSISCHQAVNVSSSNAHFQKLGSITAEKLEMFILGTF